MKELKVITLFSGYDSQCLALNRLGIPYELVCWCEVDKYAIRAHNALFPKWEGRNLGDVSAVIWSEVKEKMSEPIDLLTYSSPCQDFSNAGKQAGGARGSGTRSGLLWECERAIGVLKPRYLVFENVPALVSKKFIDTFLAWVKTLELFGYRNYWSCLNAKHYGVPQNRNRVFLVSVLGEGKPYYFPERFKLEKKLKSILEKNVDERYYLSEERVRGLLESTGKEKAAGNGFAFKPHTEDDETAGTVQTSNGRRKTDNFIAERRVHVEQILLNGDKDGNASTLTTGHDRARNITEPKGGHKQMGVMEIRSEVLYVPQGTKQGYAAVPDGGVFDMAFPTSKTRRGRVQEGGSISPTVMSEGNTLMVFQTMRIRRLTERELFRLMDVDDKDIDTLLSAGISKTQLAKMAGNSIVVNVLYHIFRTLLTGIQPESETQLALF